MSEKTPMIIYHIQTPRMNGNIGKKKGTKSLNCKPFGRACYFTILAFV
jgi:hypothetical protein